MKRMWSKNELKSISQDEAKAVKKDIATLVDSAGHDRFIEGDIDLRNTLPTGITKTFGKWSLSGTHLLIVVALDIDNAVEITSGSVICDILLPAWIKDKIVAVFGTNVLVSNQLFWNQDISNQTTNIYLRKQDGNIMIVSGALTTTKARSTRIAFDLLIDM